MKLAIATAVAAATLAAAPAAAQVSLEANAARAEEQWGAELGAGFTALSLGALRMTPGVGVFLFDGREDGYALDASDRCRETATNASAANELCDNIAAKLYARAEATFTLPVMGISAGFGGRYMSGALRPYGTASVPLMPMVSLKGNVGPDYFAAGLNARF